jgi:8-oxo-dGTP pyrophosphatase MutT (NUDIX family)
MTDFTTYSPRQLADALARELRCALPARIAQRTMAPELAYGRHHGPVPDDARRAAVLLALGRDEAGWSVPAVLRPADMKAHGGQVALPGGLIEADETPAQTALREFEEELGAETGGIEVVGSLSPVFVFVSNFEVTPLVAVSHEPLEFRPNPHEVAEVLGLPLAHLLDPGRRGSHMIHRRGLAFRAPHFEVAGRQVWGATSLILAEFVAATASVR